MTGDLIRCIDAGRWDEDLSALIDAELSPTDEAGVRAHLDTCAACRARLDALRSVDERLRAAELPPMPADLAVRLQRRIEAEADAGAATGPSRSPRGRAAPPRRRRWLVAPLAAAALAGAAAALYLAIDSGPTLLAPQPEEPPRLARAVEPVPPNAEPVVVAGEAPAESPAPEAPAEISTPIAVAVAEPVPPAAVTEAPGVADPAFDGEPDEDIALALELETVEDFDVIANLEVLEALVALDGGTG